MNKLLRITAMEMSLMNSLLQDKNIIREVLFGHAMMNGFIADRGLEAEFEEFKNELLAEADGMEEDNG